MQPGPVHLLMTLDRNVADVVSRVYAFLVFIIDGNVDIGCLESAAGCDCTSLSLFPLVASVRKLARTVCLVLDPDENSQRSGGERDPRVSASILYKSTYRRDSGYVRQDIAPTLLLRE